MTDVYYMPLREFCSLYFMLNGQTLSELQIMLCDWLEQKILSGATDIHLQAYRGFSKSTIFSLVPVWYLCCINNKRSFLMVSANPKVVTDNMDLVRRTFEQHPVAKQQISEVPARKWNSLTIRLPSAVERENSLSIININKSTGDRSDWVIGDDPETADSVETQHGRDKGQANMRRMIHLRKIGFLMTGTPHWLVTILEWLISLCNEEDVLKIPYSHDVRQPWLSEEEMEKRKIACGGENSPEWKSQYLLIPTTMVPGKLQARDYMRYKGQLVRHHNKMLIEKEDNTLTEVIDASIFWDPGSGTGRGDGSAVAFVLKDRKHNYYVHKLLDLPQSIPVEEGGEGLKRQFRVILAEMKLMGMSRLQIEKTGLSDVANDMTIFAREKFNQALKVDEVSPTGLGNKEKRIYKTMLPLMLAQKVFINEDQVDMKELEIQTDEFPKSLHDDRLDAITHAILFMKNKSNQRSNLIEPLPGDLTRKSHGVIGYVR